MGNSVVAIYPGTFDPVTLGHGDVVRRAAKLFDQLLVAVAAGHHKKALFSLSERVKMVRDEFNGCDGVTVEPFEGLLRDIVVARGAKVVVRGLRAATDLDHEFQLASMNRQLMPRVETWFFTPAHGYQSLSSTSVREIATLGGDVNQFVSPNVGVCLRARLALSRNSQPSD